MRYILILSIASFLPFLSYTQDLSYKHPFSGAYFPEKIGSFLIIEPKIYDKAGLDVGVGYGAVNEMELTEFIYPAIGVNKNTLAKDHYEAYKKDVLLAYHPELNIIEERNFMYNGKNGKFGKFQYEGKFHGSKRNLISHLYIFEDKGWFIKIRVSYTIDKDKSAERKRTCEEEISNYIKQIPWPAKGNRQ
jgi:hypothetical protein